MVHERVIYPFLHVFYSSHYICCHCIFIMSFVLYSIGALFFIDGYSLIPILWLQEHGVIENYPLYV